MWGYLTCRPARRTGAGAWACTVSPAWPGSGSLSSPMTQACNPVPSPGRRGPPEVGSNESGDQSQTREEIMFVYHENIIPFDVWQWRAWKIVVIYTVFDVFSITRRHVSISIPIFRVLWLRSENDDQMQLLSISGKFIIDFLDCVGIESFVLFWL